LETSVGWVHDGEFWKFLLLYLTFWVPHEGIIYFVENFLVTHCGTFGCCLVN
jgi:hypothetical protein